MSNDSIFRKGLSKYFYFAALCSLPVTIPTSPIWIPLTLAKGLQESRRKHNKEYIIAYLLAGTTWPVTIPLMLYEKYN